MVQDSREHCSWIEEDQGIERRIGESEEGRHTTVLKLCIVGENAMEHIREKIFRTDFKQCGILREIPAANSLTLSLSHSHFVV